MGWDQYELFPDVDVYDTPMIELMGSLTDEYAAGMAEVFWLECNYKSAGTADELGINDAPVYYAESGQCVEITCEDV